MSRKDVTIGIDVGSTAVKAIAADADGNVAARVRIPHALRVPAADRLEHDADEAWRRGPSAALAELADRTDVAAVAVSAMVPSMTAVDATGTPITPGLLYGDGRGRTPGGDAQPLPALGEAAEFLRWTAAQAPDAAGYWPAPAVANHALAGDAVIDIATAATAFPLFDGTGWDPAACAERGARVEQMPRVESMGAVVGE
ncbi:FGGY family carbohydrate kinase, partial [Mycobacterium intracellulare]